MIRNVTSHNASEMFVIIQKINPFDPSAPILYLLRPSKNLTVFSCVQGVEKGCIRNVWVNLSGYDQQVLYLCYSFSLAYVQSPLQDCIKFMTLCSWLAVLNVDERMFLFICQWFQQKVLQYLHPLIFASRLIISPPFIPELLV